MSKSSALRAIAAAAGELNDPTRAADTLQKALTAAEVIESEKAQSDLFDSIVETIGGLKDKAVMQTLLAAALDSANQEDPPVPMVKIATHYARLRQWGKRWKPCDAAKRARKLSG